MPLRHQTSGRAHRARAQQLVRVRRKQLQHRAGVGRLIRVYLEGIGLAGPGLRDWQTSRAVLAGTAPYAAAPTAVAASDLLPPAERRRTAIPVKLALAVGQQACEHARVDATALATVFSSSGGDGDTVHAIFEALAAPGREVSPTRFHNSVHNAAAGYWSIATRSRQPSTSLCCYDASFSAGLLDAAVQIAVGEAAVALIAYDHPYPEPLHSARPLCGTFAVALVLAAHATAHTLARLEVSFPGGASHATPMNDPALESLRAGVPAARSLPLLATLARRDKGVIVFDYSRGSHLRVEVAPWGTGATGAA